MEQPLNQGSEAMKSTHVGGGGRCSHPNEALKMTLNECLILMTKFSILYGLSVQE